MMCLPSKRALFKHTVERLGVEAEFGVIDSFGTAGYHVGSRPDDRSTEVCTSRGVKVSHRAQQIVRTGSQTSNDSILTMF